MQIKPPKAQEITWTKGLACFLIIAGALKASYILLGGIPLSPWHLAAIVHGGLALYFLVQCKVPWRWTKIGREPGLWLAALMIILSMMAVWWSSGWQALASAFAWHWQDLLALALIPLIEELVFRFGLGDQLKRFFGQFWGGYFSILLFAWVHILAIPAMDFMQYLTVPLGPLLLGLTCEIFWQRTRNLLIPILLHIAANMTALIFHYGDPTWLERLGSFYLGH